MTKVLEIKDRTGRTVYLADERYNHIKKHPEMQNSLAIIEETVKIPDKIMVYPLDPDVRYYQRHYFENLTGTKYAPSITAPIKAAARPVWKSSIILPFSLRLLKSR